MAARISALSTPITTTWPSAPSRRSRKPSLKPGKDILVVSIDAVPDIFKAMSEGEANATVELTPNMAGPAFDALDAYLKDKKAPAKWIQTESKLYTPADEPMKVFEEKKGQGY